MEKSWNKSDANRQADFYFSQVSSKVQTSTTAASKADRVAAFMLQIIGRWANARAKKETTYCVATADWGAQNNQQVASVDKPLQSWLWASTPRSMDDVTLDEFSSSASLT